MFKIPLCLEVIAGDEQDEMLQNMGLKTNSVDPYDEQTFIVCFYKVDAITTDTRSTAKKRSPSYIAVNLLIYAN